MSETLSSKTTEKRLPQALLVWVSVLERYFDSHLRVGTRARAVHPRLAIIFESADWVYDFGLGSDDRGKHVWHSDSILSQGYAGRIVRAE